MILWEVDIFGGDEINLFTLVESKICQIQATGSSSQKKKVFNINLSGKWVLQCLRIWDNACKKSHSLALNASSSSIIWILVIEKLSKCVVESLLKAFCSPWNYYLNPSKLPPIGVFVYLNFLYLCIWLKSWFFIEGFLYRETIT